MTVIAPFDRRYDSEGIWLVLLGLKISPGFNPLNLSPGSVSLKLCKTPVMNLQGCHSEGILLQVAARFLGCLV